MVEIIIKGRRKRSIAELNRLALELLEKGGEDSGDDEVLDRAILLAWERNLPVTFRHPGGHSENVDMTYRLRFGRGFDVRVIREFRR